MHAKGGALLMIMPVQLYCTALSLGDTQDSHTQWYCHVCLVDWLPAGAVNKGDGVVIHKASVPGGNLAPFNLGALAVSPGKFGNSLAQAAIRPWPIVSPIITVVTDSGHRAGMFPEHTLPVHVQLKQLIMTHGSRTWLMVSPQTGI